MLIGSGLQALATSGKFKPVALGQIRTAGNSVFMQLDENDPLSKSIVFAFTQSLADLGWTDDRKCGWTFVGLAVTSIGCERSRESCWTCNPTSSTA
jgi:hypothetical protein